MKLDSAHPTVRALAEVLPEADIGGGSFAHWLPHPKEVTAEHRPGVFKTAQKSALVQCLQSLLEQMSLPADTEVAIGPGGQRLWPRGYVGSITHKGTVVLGAIAPMKTLKSVGIDLERIGFRMDSRIGPFVASDSLPFDTGPYSGTLIAFSAKEAVFKAFYPLQSIRLRFSDIRLSWRHREINRHEASADCPGPVTFVVRCMRVEKWVVSAAIPASPEP